jgi:hypothetical protein
MQPQNCWSDVAAGLCRYCWAIWMIQTMICANWWWMPWEVLGVRGSARLIQALSDPDCNVAAAAAEALGGQVMLSSVPELLRHLEQNQEQFFRFNATGSPG